jgi:hypothetical protein
MAFRRITVTVPAETLALAQALTGEGIAETVRQAVRRLAQIQAQQEARKLWGTFQFTIDLREGRKDKPLFQGRR